MVAIMWTAEASAIAASEPVNRELWRAALAIAVPVYPYGYFSRYRLSQAQIDLESKIIAAVFRRSVDRQTAERRAAKEQARYDREYEARRRRKAEIARSEQELEREARRDDWPARPQPRPKRALGYGTITVARDPIGPSPIVIFSLPRSLSAALGFECSDIEALEELSVPLVGFRSTPHSRRRAYFSRWGSTSRPVTLARVA